jgi:hypothetical protein
MIGVRLAHRAQKQARSPKAPFLSSASQAVSPHFCPQVVFSRMGYTQRGFCAWKSASSFPLRIFHLPQHIIALIYTIIIIANHLHVSSSIAPHGIMESVRSRSRFVYSCKRTAEVRARTASTFVSFALSASAIHLFNR